jgi:hypothetical protein
MVSKKESESPKRNGSRLYGLRIWKAQLSHITAVSIGDDTLLPMLLCQIDADLRVLSQWQQVIGSIAHKGAIALT